MPKTKTILVAPLHWGLGHATRCIPLITALLQRGFKVVIASDGAALSLLRKEFPELTAHELPSYDIRYPKKGSFFTWLLLLKFPRIRKAIVAENKIVLAWVQAGKIDGIISDNRPGVRHAHIPSVYITHQLKVLSGLTTSPSTKIHLAIIKKFTACWVPDIASEECFSGAMGHLKNEPFPIHYMGILSRMKPKVVPKVYDIMCILSGPEPQRSLLEAKLIEELKDCGKEVLLVQGLPMITQESNTIGSISMVPFMTSEALEKAINESSLIICRSGYTSIMDLAMLQKKVFFIPTPGQYEQRYLAKRLERKRIAPHCKQDNFTLKQLEKTTSYTGFITPQEAPNFDRLFGLFEGE